MDTFDVRLLQALIDDSRQTNQELADRIGLSPSQCSRRRAVLEENGTIEGCHARVSLEAVGLDVVAFVQVTLATHSPDNAQRFIALVQNLDEVQEAYAMTGEADYLVKVLAHDLKALARVLNDVFLPHDSVAHVRSSIVLERLKESPRVPLGHVSAGTHEARPPQQRGR